jgi:methionine-rich copper-binding protein CopC
MATLTTPGAETRVNTTTASDQGYSSVTALSDGGYVVTWMSLSQDGSGWGVYAQRYDATGDTVGSETRVNTTTASDQEFPTGAALSDGGYVVTWMSDSQDGSGVGIYAQQYDQLGNAVGGEIPVNTTTAGDQLYPYVTALSDGGYVVTWTSDSQDGRLGCRWRRSSGYHHRYGAIGSRELDNSCSTELD